VRSFAVTLLTTPELGKATPRTYSLASWLQTHGVVRPGNLKNLEPTASATTICSDRDGLLLPQE
jgi:hypothetical protein